MVARGLRHRQPAAAVRSCDEHRRGWLDPLPGQPAVADEGEQPVRFLGQCDRAEPGEHRHEVVGGDEGVDAAARKNPADPVEQRRATGEREPREQRSPGSPDPERDGQREPEQSDQRRCRRLTDGKAEQPQQTPPTPAMAADSPKTKTFVRFTRIPDASAATSELRMASMARPEEERMNAWIASVIRANTTRKSRIWSGSWLALKWGLCPTTTRSCSQLRPGMERLGAGMRPAGLPVADRLDREDHQGADEGERQRSQRQADSPQLGDRPGHQHSDRAGDGSPDDHREQEVEMAMRRRSPECWRSSCARGPTRPQPHRW